MTANELVRRLLQYWLYLLLLPLTMAASVYFFARFQSKKYTSETVLYTGITSGYQIVGDNNRSSHDLDATNTAFSNLISLVGSREVREEACLRLLAWQLLAEANRPAAYLPTNHHITYVLGSAARAVFAPQATPYAQFLTPAYRGLLLGNTLDETTARLTAYYGTSATNAVYKVVNSKDPSFSTDALGRVLCNRLHNSDMLSLSYTSSSPAICQKTLEFLTEVAIRKNKELFAGQSDSVITYFARATSQAQARLQAAEQRRLAFEQQHSLADYDQQVVVLTNERQATAASYGSLEMEYAGATATLASIGRTLRQRGIQTRQSEEIMGLRNRLASLNSQATELALAAPTTATTAQLAGVRQQAARLADKIEAKVKTYYQGAPVDQGAVVKNLLADYGKTTLRAEDLRSQLALLRRQKDLAASHYHQLVPQGVAMSQIRRQVEVAEKDYFSQAEGLKKSQLAQHNGDLTGHLRVVDPPYLPGVALDDKKPQLMLLGALAMLLLTGAAVATTGVLDTSLQHPEQATKDTSFAVAGVVPEITKPQHQQLAYQAEGTLARQLLLQVHRQPQGGQPYTIGILSSYGGEGKTNVACNLAASLNAMGIKTLSMFPDDHRFQIIPNDDTLFYSPRQGLTPGTTVAELADQTMYSDEVVIIEFPAVFEHTYPASVLRSLDLILVSVRAERTWQLADRNIFAHIQQLTTAPIELVLNGVLPEYVTEVVGARAGRASARPARAPAPAPALPAHPLPGWAG